jgi:type IV pilus assembly protein PilM
VDEQSIWKKEISFRRKPKQAAKREDPPTETPSQDAQESSSIWKKELSFGRKVKKAAAAPVAAEADVAPDSTGHGQVSDTETRPEEPVAVALDSSGHGQVSDTETRPEEPVSAEPVAAEADVAADASSHGQVSDTETGPEESVWKKEVSFSRKTEPEAVAEEATAEESVAQEIAAETAAEELVADEPVAEPVAEEPITDEPVLADERVAEETPAEETPAEETPAEETPAEETPAEETPAEESLAEETPAEEVVAEAPAAETPTEELVAEEPVAPEPVAPVPAQPVAAETWTAKPSLPPEPVAEVPTVVHPPVPAAELPPLADVKLPFWKKEISFGGKKRDKAPKAERAPKQPKQPKQPRQREPKKIKVKAERGAKGSKRLVGLKIGASQLAAARVANNGSAELLQVARERLEPGIVVGGELRDPDALAAALKDFFAKHKLPKRGVRLGIANNRIGVRTFEIAGIVDQKQLANAIRFRAQEALPIPIDQAVLDYQILGEGVNDEGQPTRRILLVVAYRELIDRYVDACKKAGIVLAGIDLEAFALLRALQAPQAGAGNDPSAALVAVAIGHERSTFAVSDGRVCEFTRVLEWGGSALNVAIARVLNAAPSEVEAVKHALTLTDSTVPEGLTADEAARAAEAARKAVQTFARELVSSLQYYQNQPGSLGIGEIVLTGGTAHLPGLAGELERLIGVRVRVGNPLARMKVSKKIGDPEQIGSLAVAIGLGIDD